MSRGRAINWAFTIFADTEQEVTWMVGDIALPFGERLNKVTYAFYQLERCPETGRLHLQGYAHMKNQMKLAEVKCIHGTAHWEPCKGNPSQNEAYCGKEASRVRGPFTYGRKPQQGHRTDWEMVRETIAKASDDGKHAVSNREMQKKILMDWPQFAPCTKGIEALVQAFMPAPPLERDIVVYYLSGETGMGKTHRAMHQFPEAFMVRGKYIEGKTFDLYEGQTELILDEFDPMEWPMTLMNSMLDKWKCPLQCRYFNKFAYWTKVVICSNVALMDCYPMARPGQREAFIRRVDMYVLISSREQAVEFS